MSKLTNQEVIQEWANSREGEAGRLTTNGFDLFSYDLKIGITADDGSKIVLDYTAGGGAYKSQTTSTHVGRAKSVADQIILPQAAALGGLT